MAIVINGSGTITGISAGGLPDGTVTADDLASTLDLSGKTVTLAAGGTGYGKVLQVVQGTLSTRISSSSTSFIATDLDVSITPSSATSKILIIVSAQANNEASGGTVYTTIFRGATNLGDSSNGFGRIYNGGARDEGFVSMTYLDSPATTSSTTYTVYARCISGAFQFPENDNMTNTITAMEIAA